MASTIETAKLIVEAENRGFTETDAAIKKIEADLATLTVGYKAGTVPLNDYLSQGARLQNELGMLSEAYKKAQDALQKYGSTQAASAALGDQAQKSLGQAQQRITALGYAFNDFFSVSGGIDQRLNAIANNLPMIFAGLGSIGLALGAIVPIAAAVIKNFDAIKESLFGILKESDFSLEGLKKHLQELESKKVKVGLDATDLATTKEIIEQIEAGLATISRLKKTQTEAEKVSGQKIEEVIATQAGGPQATIEALRTQQRESVIAQGTAQIKDQIKAKEKEIQDREKALSEAAKGGEIEAVQSHSMLLETSRKELEDLVKAKLKKVDEILAPNGELDRIVGITIEQATKGTGVAKTTAEETLIAGLKKAGQEGLAAQVRMLTTAYAEVVKEEGEYDKNRQKFKNDLGDLLTKAGEKAEDAALTPFRKLEETQKTLLNQLRGDDRTRGKVDELLRAARQRGENDVQTYESVTKGLYDYLKAELEKKGALTTGPQVGALARGFAEQAPELARGAQQQREVAFARQQAARTPEVARQDAAIQAGGYIPLAERALAQTQAAGGTMDQFGRFQPVKPAQQQEAVRRQVEQDLRRRNPKMPAEQRRDLSAQITSAAAEKLQQELQQEHTQQLNLAGQTVGAMSRLNAEATQNHARMMALEAIVARINAQITARANGQANAGRGG
jgi:hypothetical protein